MSAFPSLASVPYINPLGHSIEWKTIISQYDDLGAEQRKQKWLYPRRNLKLTYAYLTFTEVSTLWEFYLARKGSYEAFNFFFPFSETYVGEYVGTGDGSTVIFNLPAKTSTHYKVYIDSVAQTESTNYTFGSGTGADGEDKVKFTAAPTDGARITYDFTGYLKVRCRFEDDKMDMETFYARLTGTGLKLKGLLNA
jgi:uncharacterized protein (TIGR02217 family)